MRFIASLLLMMVLAGLPLYSQVKQCNVVVPVTVRAESGDAPATLTGSNFSVRLGNLKATQELVVPANSAPARVAILLDTSGSMRTKWWMARSLAINILRLLDPAHEVALVAFSEKVTGGVPLTRDREAIIRVVRDARPPAGRTAIMDTILGSIRDVPLRRSDVIVIITDGGDNRSATRESKLLDLIVASGVRVFPVAIYDANFATPEEMAGPTLLNELRDTTGGDSVDVVPSDLHTVGKPPRLDDTSVERLRRELSRMTMTIDHPLLLRVAWPSPAGGSKPPKLKVEVVDQFGHRMKNLIVRYPQRINGCAAEAQAQVPVSAKPN